MLRLAARSIPFLLNAHYCFIVSRTLRLEYLPPGHHPLHHFPSLKLNARHPPVWPSLRPSLALAEATSVRNSRGPASADVTPYLERRPDHELSSVEEIPGSSPSIALCALPTGRDSCRFNDLAMICQRDHCYGKPLLRAHRKPHRHHASQRR